jgi:hypothetical protein
VVTVAELGKFRIRQGERQKDGQKLAVKRISFALPKSGAGTGKKVATKGGESA